MFDLTRFVDAHESQLLQMLRKLPSGEALRTVGLEPEDTVFASGTRPAAIFRDGSGRRYFFKVPENEQLVAAEVLACEVRDLGGRPTVPTARRVLRVADLGEREGMLQPIVENTGSVLSSDPILWSLLQREVLLREHPWEWLLANLDTHADQYILVGPSMHPLNIDWDHSMWDIDVTELTRFTKRGVAIAPIRNLLYDAYANRTLRFDFYGLRREVTRITHLDDDKLAAAVERYALAIGAPEEQRRVLIEKVLARKRDLPEVFQKLVASMRRERAEALYGPANPLSAVRRTVTKAQDAWQRVLVTVLHDKLVKRFLKVYRGYLTSRSKMKMKS